MSHPETDQDFRERLIRIVDRHHRADVMIASGAGLDGFGRMYGMARKGLPEGSFEDPVVKAFQQVERDMAQPAVIPMAPGERPTEPGWYVVNTIFGLKGGDAAQFNKVAHIIRGDDGALRYDDKTKNGRIANRHTFIARIYPDRIEGKAP